MTLPGEPVTHFNLDQLLEIVQSFQLDTSQASSQEAAGVQAHKVNTRVTEKLGFKSLS